MPILPIPVPNPKFIVITICFTDDLLKILNNHHGDGDQLNNNIKEQQLIAEKSRGKQTPEPVRGCGQYTSSLDCT